MTTMIPTWVNGRFVPMDKLETHRRGLLHLAVSVFVVCDGEILLQRRALGKYHSPGLWANTCCTHPHPGEDAEACAHRRLHEELGITGLHLQHRKRVTYRADVGRGLIEHERVDIFVAEVTERLALRPNADEVLDVAWVNATTLADRTRRNGRAYTPWLKIYLADHAEEILAGCMAGAAIR